MRSSLLSIGEASKLKNVSIKALRYYEKIGIFKPAYIDPQSGYRYYSPAQLFDLDVILTCNELDIPLKRILDYQTKHGTDLRQLLKEGAKIAELKIQRAQQSLIQINSCLEEIEEQSKHRLPMKRYTRSLNFNYAYTMPWNNTRPFEIKHYLKTMSDLYQRAERLGSTPLYFQGLIIDSGSKPICLAFVAIDFYPNKTGNPFLPNPIANVSSAAPDSTANASNATPNPITNVSNTTSDSIVNAPCATSDSIIPGEKHQPKVSLENDLCCLPETTFSGFRLESNDLTKCINEALSYTQDNPGFYVMTEIWDAEVAANTYAIELLQSGKILNVSVSD